MGKIHRLAPHEAHKIAAGEVVERPANIVKELIENALDAGTSKLTLYIEDGGKKLIRLVDNGCGMSAEDAQLAFEHHATSKITKIEDLASLTTFGFRGEALSSISSVSKIKITTKEEDAATATHLEMVAGDIIKQELASGNTGTDIAISDIFFNVPARKKFLKSKETEWRAILHLVQATCLSYLNLQVTVYHENKTVLLCPPATSIAQRFEQLFDVSTQLLETTAQGTGSLSITAALSQPQYARYDRQHMFFFVNNRWVKNHKLGQALMRGYQNVLPPQRYPAAVIAIIIDPALVDVNIHPRKEEVQFLHPRQVEDLVEEMVSARLQKFRSTQIGYAPQKPLTLPEMPFEELSTPSPTPSLEEQSAFSAIITAALGNPAEMASKAIPQPAVQAPIFTHHAPRPEILPLLPSEDGAPQEATGAWASYRLIGQLAHTYLMLETDEGLVLIDQHAAHERILYDEFEKRFKSLPSIELLFPPIITLTQQDYAIISEHLSLFEHYGVTVEPCGPLQFMVKATPVSIKSISFDELFGTVIGWVHEFQHVNQQELAMHLHHNLRAQMACKGAVKAGDVLSLQAMHELINQLNATPNRLICAHGRPTSWVIPLTEIERKFKRRK